MNYTVGDAWSYFHQKNSTLGLATSLSQDRPGGALHSGGFLAVLKDTERYSRSTSRKEQRFEEGEK